MANNYGGFPILTQNWNSSSAPNYTHPGNLMGKTAIDERERRGIQKKLFQRGFASPMQTAPHMGLPALLVREAGDVTYATCVLCSL